jgi:hypothetical protein
MAQQQGGGYYQYPNNPGAGNYGNGGAQAPNQQAYFLTSASWSQSLFGCMGDMSTCCYTTFCPFCSLARAKSELRACVARQNRCFFHFFFFSLLSWLVLLCFFFKYY